MEIKVLFTDGIWQLIGPTWGDSGSRIQHLCREDDIQPYPKKWYTVYTSYCAMCQKRPPEALIGLKKLHDWDR